MTEYMQPFTLDLDVVTGKLDPATSEVQRRLTDMRGMFGDADAEAAAAESGDPMIYEVLQYDVPGDNGQLVVCTTVLQPGRVGNEYFMTKGHYHAKRETGEVYVGLQGEGKLLMEVDEEFSVQDMRPGTVAYVPPYWAHRTANTGDKPFIFLAVYPADAGHDYGTIERDGFRYRVIERDGGPVLVPSRSGIPAVA
jgi:glucose-6-phosphate isomerase, archaeal